MQVLFSVRFFGQWIKSACKKAGVFLSKIWYFSLVLPAYAVYRQDPVFIFWLLSGLAIFGVMWLQRRTECLISTEE
ncbi:MAG: lipid-A-disaccharide synthase N-terminal domain-containing protein [Methylobacter sp.]